MNLITEEFDSLIYIIIII